MKNRLGAASILKKSTSRFGRIIILTGARQTGKTTLIKRIFPNYSYISIEDPIMVEQYTKLSASQWEENYPNAILDEVQKEPQLIESIKSVYDQFPKPRYILLGSSQIMLLKKIRESLAGRCQIVELFALTLPELLTNTWDQEVYLSQFQKLMLHEDIDNMPFLLDKAHAKKIKVFENYLQFGGYPAISDELIPENEKTDWLKNYIKTYLERDIRDLAEMRNLQPFVKTQRLMALNTGQLLNMSKIATEAGVSSKTIQRFIEYMTISYQTLYLPPWSRNERKRLVKSPKIHFLDPGVLRGVIQKKGELNGHEFESAVIAELYKQLKAIQVDAQFYHLRTLDGREIDLLLETETGYIAIEIKQSSKVRPVDGKNLKGIEHILDKPVLNKIVLSNDMENKDLGNEITAFPVVKFLT